MSQNESDYARSFQPYKKILARVLKHDPLIFDLPKQSKILDVGCGFGDDIRRLRSLGYADVVGVEPDAACVAQRGDLEIRQGTIEKTGYPPNLFDVVLVDNVFHHVGNYEAALDEVGRVLKDGGLLCFIEPRNSILRRSMDWLTFQTPLPRVNPWVKTRYDVMIQEIETGLYPQWLRSHARFFSQLESRFDVEWKKEALFFFFCKARKKPNRIPGINIANML